MCQEVMLRDVHTMAVEVGNILHAMRGLLDAGRLGVVWFLPVPVREAAQLPAWDELGLAGPKRPGDLSLDIVFDV